ncbi:MAG: hypothetical protein SNJ71_00035 [Bacteroidales bacterium]
MKRQQYNRALTPLNLIEKRHKTLPFTGKWYDSIGEPELSGSWLIWGPSANGKTRFAIQLAKYLSRFVRVAYNSLEEGVSRSLQRTVEQECLHLCKNIIILDKEPLPELHKRLAAKRSPAAVIIDSVQYTQMSYADYIAFMKRYPSKLFVFVSHADGREPSGRVARAIRYDANVKIRIEGYVAQCVSRYGGGAPYIVWQEGAEKIGTIKKNE